MSSTHDTVSEEQAPVVREAKPRGVLCPYCGEVSPDLKQCRGCRAFLDPLSRQASQNEMGPWFVRDPAHPFRPGCSFATIRRLVERARIGPMTVIRGPTTRQTWSFAGRTPSVANLLGLCHNCQREVSPEAFSCPGCGASFAPETNRQHLGLAPVHLLPGQAPAEEIASALAPPPTAAHGGWERSAVSRVSAPTPRVTPGAPVRPSPIEPAPSPGRVGEVAAWRARVARLRVAAAVLLVVVLALAGAVGAMLSGVRLDRWFAEASAGVSGSASERAAPAPAQPEPARNSPEPGTIPAEASPPDTGGEPVPVEPPPAEPAPPGSDDAPAPPERGLSLAEELMPLLTREPLDVGAVRVAADEALSREPTAGAWLSAAERRAALLRLRSLP